MASSAAPALEPVQRELRARKYYFGPVDGRDSGELHEALRKFQTDKGLEATKQPDPDTLRALGLRSAPDSEQDAALEACRSCVLNYLQARERGDPQQLTALFAESVDYFDDGPIAGRAVLAALTREDARWPQRKFTLLDRIASLNHWRPGEALVTARVRTEVVRGTERRVRTEDLRFQLRQVGGLWQIAGLKLLE